MDGTSGGRPPRKRAEPGWDRFGQKLRYYSTTVLPPVIGALGLLDELIVRRYLFGEPMDYQRVIVSAILVGVVPARILIDRLGGRG